MVTESKIVFGLTVCLLAFAAGDPNVAAPNVALIDDIRRPELEDLVHPDGSSAITGLYARVSPKQKWAGGLVYWAYDPASNNFTEEDKTLIAQGLEQLSTRTCIQFAERTTQANYVTITNNVTGCFSFLGYIGRPQQLNLGRGCMFLRTIMHEMMHAMGFEHEQTRYDRDLYIEIQWQNIHESNKNNFNKQPRSLSFPRFELDFRSVMMYGLSYFAIDKTMPTMKVVFNPKMVPEAEIGVKTVNLTDTDVQRIKSAYKCPSALYAKNMHDIENFDEKEVFSNFF